MLAPLRLRLRKHVATWPWRRVGVLASVSLGLALLLVGYLFELSDHFFTRLFFAFLVLFWLLAVTFLAVVPFVTWATGHWFGRDWADAPARASQPRRAIANSPTRSYSSPAASQWPEKR
ncbi:hypothetical protein IC235_17875 [Hymenobacter sp. BT664]|uniref:Uncharacterized protein n=1 Tax=Hymenobacter montanus TaxID=2771359 RepID=A0A927BF79_9BACT|nr:hypothetical protein [Hymenobacter montanus]MBD2769762.1 hypothetical protein [Hymenobacter montanus]